MSETSRPAAAEPLTPFAPFTPPATSATSAVSATTDQAAKSPNVPKVPTNADEWRHSREFLRYLSGQGVPEADRFVKQNAGMKYEEVRRFYGAINPDPTLGGKDLAAQHRYELGLGEGLIPNSLADTLTAIRAVKGTPEAERMAAMAKYLQDALQFCSKCDQPTFPEWANRSMILRGQRAFMTRLLPATIVLLCKSLPEAYAAPRPSSVLNLSRQLSNLPFHRLLGTLQLLVTVSTPHSFEGPWYPALLAAEEMQLLHAGVRSLVAPRVDTEQRGPAERTFDGWGERNDYVLWGGYTAFRQGWPHSDDKSDSGAAPPQEVVNQADMLATIIAFSLLVVDGLRQLKVAFKDDDAEAFWHLWRVFAVFKGIHPPGEPMSDAWIPKTLGDARCFWLAYQQEYYVTESLTWSTEHWQEKARQANPAGCALASAHVVMIAQFINDILPGPVPKRWCLKVARWFVWRLCGEDGAARIGIPKVRMWPWERWLLENFPRAASNWIERFDVGIQSAIGRWALTTLISKLYGSRVIFPIPEKVEDLKRFVADTKVDKNSFVKDLDTSHREAAAAANA